MLRLSKSANHLETHPRPCEICGGNSKSHLYRQNFLAIPEGSILTGYDVVSCQACGFGFADNVPDQDAFDRYYERMSKYEYAAQGGTQNNFSLERFPSAAEFVAAHLPDKHLSVLDIGCSNGGMLDALRQVGFEKVTGLDPSPACAQAALDLYGIPVMAGTLFDPPASPERFGLVVLGAVLEHIRNLRQAMAMLRSRYLGEDAYVFVEVPDVAMFASEPDAPFQEFSVEHINYFSTQSLENLFAASGFECIALRKSAQKQGHSTMAHVIEAIFRVRKAEPGQIRQDTETPKALCAYVAASRNIEDGIKAVIDPLSESKAPIMVWGVGTHTQRLLASSSLREANVIAYIDSNTRYQGKTLNGIDIIAPDDIAKRGSYPILISSRFFQQEIALTIRDQLLLQNPVILLYQL